jgi:hypothetical protein
MIAIILIGLYSDSDATVGHWFYTNAPAAWISAVIATVGFLLVLRSRKKPKRIIVRETKNATLVTIWPSVRNNIELFYTGSKINTLAQVELDIFNQGSEVIQCPSIGLMLPTESRVLGMRLTPDNDDTHQRFEGNKVILTLPYINPIGEHKHIWKLSILADGDTEQIVVSGGGEGWSVQHSPLPTADQLRSRRTILTIAAVCSLMFSVFFNSYIQDRYGIGFFEVSWRALLTGSIGSLPLGVVAVLTFRLLDFRSRVQ